MQRAQRTFGRFLKRSPNEADVEAMLTDFNDSESMLTKVSAMYLFEWKDR
jgi:amphiphysin